MVDDSYLFTFSIYDNVTSGTKLWTENQLAPTNKGIYQVTLGTVNSLDTLPFEGSCYIQISVDNTTLPNRYKLITVPYAITANKVTGEIGANTHIANDLVTQSVNGLKDCVTLAGASGISVMVDTVTNTITFTGILHSIGQ